MTVSDTHADTNLGGETPVLDGQRGVSPDGVDDAVVVGPSHPAGEGWRWPTFYEHYLAMLDERNQAASQRDRERARADRAEALDRAAYYYRRELREIIQDCGHDEPDIRKIRERAESAIRAADHELAALSASSAGSGGRATTLDEADLQVEPWGRADHPTMDGVVRNPRGVRITHVPTGLSGEWDEEKSQLRNRERALAILRDKIALAGGRATTP